MNTIIKEIIGGNGFSTIKNAYEAGHTPLLVNGVCESARAHFCAACASSFEKKLLLFVPDEKTAKAQAEILEALGLSAAVFPARDYLLENIKSYSKEWEQERIGVLSGIISGSYDAVIAVPDAVMQYTIPHTVLNGLSFTLERGKRFSREQAISHLASMGYTRTEIVDGSGQYAVRGSILDVFSPMYEQPFRVDFFGDEIDLIGFFDIVSQRRGDNVSAVTCVPVTELLVSEESRGRILKAIQSLMSATVKTDVRDTLRHEYEAVENGAVPNGTDKYYSLLYESNETLLDYTAGYLTVIYESKRVIERARAEAWQYEQAVEAMAEAGTLKYSNAAAHMRYDLFIAALEGGSISFDLFPGSALDFSDKINVYTQETVSFASSFELLYSELREFIEDGKKTVIFTASSRTQKNLIDNLGQNGIPSIAYTGTVYDNTVSVGVSAPLAELDGFRTNELVFIADNTAQGGRRITSKRRLVTDKKHKGEKIASYADLSVGDLVVHANHGIGRYIGIQNLTSDGASKDYIKIQYAGTDYLYVPCNQLDLVTKYIGQEDVKISKLGTAEWQKSKAKAKTAASNIAKELIALYGERRLHKAYAFPQDDDYQHEFEDAFRYAETDGQLTASKEIKKDMENEIPMDRLLCGDVGFGKTEVALRAVFKCVCAGKQAAILVPTTILAWQHYETMLSRFRTFPVVVQMLSRFRDKAAQADIIEKVKRGKIDVIVGTHRLLQKDIGFRDLGLVVIDEEQRFGVTHKEKLKQLAKNVHVLTLSATPIPRTLNMALSGIRDLSVLEEAPEGRLPVQSFVLEHDDVIIREALRKEMRRGGQAFYLHNNINTIYAVASRISNDFPDNTVGVAHGQMSRDELSKIWEALVKGEIDILVCTTIIETGVDVPNANTLIIEDANRMGLSQLHQIRGRVGRSERKAYAYFTYREGTLLSEIAMKRLQAIKEYTEFGSGFKIAMRDLELRGAGNLLGAEQHGHMDAIGYDLYIKLLEEAVNEEKGIFTEKKRDCLVDIAVDAFIPEEYVPSSQLRIDIYRKIAHIDNEEDRDDIVDELLDRFGKVPDSVENLINISLIRNYACAVNIYQIEQKLQLINLYLEKYDAQVCVATASNQELRGSIMLSLGNKPCISYRIKSGENKLEGIKKLLKVYTELSQK